MNLRIRPSRFGFQRPGESTPAGLLRLGALLTLTAASCTGSAPRQPAATAPELAAPRPEGATESPGAMRAEIDVLHRRIGELRTQAGHSREPAPSSPEEPMSDRSGDAETGETEHLRCTSYPGSCGDPCSLSAAICESADKICGLAEELSGDAWAAEKCQSARKSCGEASALCCGCVAETPR